MQHPLHGKWFEQKQLDKFAYNDVYQILDELTGSILPDKLSKF